MSDSRELIGGFIVAGDTPKTVLIRGLGPSLEALGVTGTLSDPMVQLFDASGESIGQNDDWPTAQRAEIEATSIAPVDGREAAMIRTLAPGAYTVALTGANAAPGVALIEVYDLEVYDLASGALTRIANISARGFVDQDSNVMIGGFVVGAGAGSGGSGTTRVLIRALGPTLVDHEITTPLADPVIEIYNAQGEQIGFNDDWRTAQPDEIVDTGIPPQDDRESALVMILPAGAYTAIVSGKAGATGVGLFEVYDLQ